MTGIFAIDDAAAVSAARVLSRLTALVGATGLAAAAKSPGLLAAVDQHAAAVRDALTDGRRTPGAVALAAYAQGVADAARDGGWRLPPPADGIDWARTDWPTLRLVAVCMLALSHLR